MPVVSPSLPSSDLTPFFVFTGNYSDSLSDARVATELQPNYLKAIERGMIS